VLERCSSGPERGLRLEFLLEERERQELVLAWAAGESVPYFRRAGERVPCHLQVRIAGDGREPLDTVGDVISRGGVHVQAAVPLEPDSTVLARDRAPGPPPAAPARRARGLGHPRRPQEGAGIEFLFESAAQRDEVATASRASRSSAPADAPQFLHMWFWQVWPLAPQSLQA